MGRTKHAVLRLVVNIIPYISLDDKEKNAPKIYRIMGDRYICTVSRDANHKRVRDIFIFQNGTFEIDPIIRAKIPVCVFCLLTGDISVYPMLRADSRF